MTSMMDELYDFMVGDPKPHLWPDYLKAHPEKGHGLYAFQIGLKLGLLLATEAFYPETEL